MGRLVAVLMVWIVILFISGLIGMFAWPYAINTWLIFAGKEATCTMLNGFLLGLVPVIGQWSILAAVLTWLIMLFL